MNKITGNRWNSRWFTMVSKTFLDSTTRFVRRSSAITWKNWNWRSENFKIYPNLTDIPDQIHLMPSETRWMWLSWSIETIFGAVYVDRQRRWSCKIVKYFQTEIFSTVVVTSLIFSHAYDHVWSLAHACNITCMTHFHVTSQVYRELWKKEQSRTEMPLQQSEHYNL